MSKQTLYLIDWNSYKPLPQTMISYLVKNCDNKTIYTSKQRATSELRKFIKQVKNNIKKDLSLLKEYNEITFDLLVYDISSGVKEINETQDLYHYDYETITIRKFEKQRD